MDNATREILKELVAAAAEPSEQAQKKLALTLERINDDRLVAIAKDALTNLKRAKGVAEGLFGEVRAMRKELERLRADHALEERALQEARKALKERDDLAATVSELRKQMDPERQQLEVMYAIDEASAAAREEISSLRRELSQRQAEIGDLKTSKKRLREAIDRLAGKE